jgi:hypothetical protein
VRGDVEVIPEELAREIRRYGVAYLLTVGAELRPHVAAAHPSLERGELLVTGLGSHTRANLAASPAVTLLCPPPDPHGYSLVVDGAGEVRGEDLVITPTRAVLHRPAPAPSPSSAGGCQADCIELPLPGTSSECCPQ